MESAGGSSRDQPSYHLVLNGPGLTLDRDVTEAQAWEVMAVIFGQNVSAPINNGHGPNGAGPTAPSKETGAQAAAPQRKPRTSVGEYLRATKATKNTEKIAAFAAYFQEHEDKELFTREEVSQQFQAAREKKPGNFHRDFNAAIRNQWIAVDSDGSNFYLTNTGYDAVHNGFKGDSEQER
ncbi:hypothetical protein [Pseudonocardia sp. ICBG1142]|uniref:hypothetical protein n=1 Tax=Pseudonocardia sp. ICBG1142 TaxID=2846760 RepID=UPI001CF63B8F|nr:hypothetical protein [Pseudonocardia sp. ICBG1142]